MNTPPTASLRLAALAVGVAAVILTLTTNSEGKP